MFWIMVAIITGMLVFAVVGCIGNRSTKWKAPVKTNIGYISSDVAARDTRIVVVAGVAAIDSSRKPRKKVLGEDDTEDLEECLCEGCECVVCVCGTESDEY
jgi:hypothetical protein